MKLVRIRYQETWGDQLGGYVGDPVLESEISEVVRTLAGEWFPCGHSLSQDTDMATAWVASEEGSETRIWFFTETIGGG